MNKTRLENWSIKLYPHSPYAAPETGIPVLTGEVSNHPHVEDGKVVTTSKLEFIDTQAMIARTHSREYSLGEPSEDFTIWLQEHDYTLSQYEKVLNGDSTN